jgi:hypothetical protein
MPISITQRRPLRQLSDGLSVYQKAGVHVACDWNPGIVCHPRRRENRNGLTASMVLAAGLERPVVQLLATKGRDDELLP